VQRHKQQKRERANTCLGGDLCIMGHYKFVLPHVTRHWLRWRSVSNREALGTRLQPRVLPATAATARRALAATEAASFSDAVGTCRERVSQLPHRTNMWLHSDARDDVVWWDKTDLLMSLITVMWPSLLEGWVDPSTGHWLGYFQRKGAITTFWARFSVLFIRTRSC